MVEAGNTQVGDGITLDQYLEMRHVIFHANGKPFFHAWFECSHGDKRSVEVMANSFMLPGRRDAARAHGAAGI